MLGHGVGVAITDDFHYLRPNTITAPLKKKRPDGRFF